MAAGDFIKPKINFSTVAQLTLVVWVSFMRPVNSWKRVLESVSFKKELREVFVQLLRICYLYSFSKHFVLSNLTEFKK